VGSFSFTAKLALIFIGCGLLTACVVHDSPTRGFAENQANIEHLQRSVVALVQEDSVGRVVGPTCTAFWVGPRLLATAHHCVVDRVSHVVVIAPGISMVLHEEREPEPTVGRKISFVDRASYENWIQSDGSAFGDNPEVRTAVVVAGNEENDIALMELEETDTLESRDFLRIRPFPVAVGERIFTMGMPQGQQWILSEGMIVGLRNTSGRRNRLLHNAHIAPGASGSPLIDNDGFLVGVNVAYVSGASYLAVAIPIAPLEELMLSLTNVTKHVAPRLSTTCNIVSRSCS